MAEAQQEGNGAQAQEQDDDDFGRNRELDRSHTSFKSMMSGATIFTQHEREINKLVHQDITEQEDLDEYLEKLLAVQRQKGAIMQKRF